MSVLDFINDLDERAKAALNESVDLLKVDTVPDVGDMYAEVPKWHDIKEVAVVVADLKGSTKLNVSKYGQTTARIYEATTSNLVRAVKKYDPAFVDIQGDGLFAIFDGDRADERAFCAAVTLMTWSRDLAEQIATQYPKVPDTGIKVGIDKRRVLVKKVGVRGTNEPVWAGKPVNYATKAAQIADAHQVVVTERFFNVLKDNEWISHSCGCGSGYPAPLWTPVYNEKLPGTDVQCQKLESFWCETHGDETHDAILEGRTERDDVDPSQAA